MPDVTARDGGTLVGQPVPGDSASERLLTSLGYRPLWTSWVLELPAGDVIAPQPLPEGYAVRPASGEADHRAAWVVNEDAFLEWSERERSTFEEWAADRREPARLRGLAAAPGHRPRGTVVGMAFVIVSSGCAFVDKLAVRKDQRGRGLARALLVDAFETGRAHGGDAPSCRPTRAPARSASTRRSACR